VGGLVDRVLLVDTVLLVALLALSLWRLRQPVEKTAALA
jgi:hypothetical protein